MIGRASGLTHVYAVDLVRVLTLACVIAAHTTASVNSLDSVSAGGAAMLLHFTPVTFFALTAFVLVYPYRDALAASLRADRGALRHLDHDLHRAGTDHGAAATDRSTDPTRINGQGADSPSPTPSPSYNNSPSPTLRPARPWPSPKAVPESSNVHHLQVRVHGDAAQGLVVRRRCRQIEPSKSHVLISCGRPGTSSRRRACSPMFFMSTSL
jgi:hypothetical protein